MAKLPGRYRVRVRGQLGPEWSDWFEGLSIGAEPNGDTTIEGPVQDQAALHGLLARIRDLNLPLLSVESFDTADAAESRSERSPCRAERHRRR